MTAVHLVINGCPLAGAGKSYLCIYFTRLSLFTSHAQAYPRDHVLLILGEWRRVSLFLFLKFLGACNVYPGLML